MALATTSPSVFVKFPLMEEERTIFSLSPVARTERAKLRVQKQDQGRQHYHQKDPDQQQFPKSPKVSLKKLKTVVRLMAFTLAFLPSPAG